MGGPGAVGRGDRRPQAARPRAVPPHERDRVRQPVLVRPRPAGAGAGVRQAVRQHGVRRQVRLQHLVDAGAAPDLRHQHAADDDGLDLPRRGPEVREPAWSRRCRRTVKAYKARGGDDGTPADIWQDVIASYAALGDPDAGAALWNRKGSVEGGETRSHTALLAGEPQGDGHARLHGHGRHAAVRGVQGQERRADLPGVQRAQHAHPGEVQHGQVRSTSRRGHWCAPAEEAAGCQCNTGVSARTAHW